MMSTQGREAEPAGREEEQTDASVGSIGAPSLDFLFLREQIVGVDSTFTTPFGDRLLVYCDYTASGRCLAFVEKYLQNLQRHYANTHTEDDVTGRSMSRLLHDAEQLIKQAVNAGPQGKIIACGTGATGAIEKLQQIIGVALPAATRETLLTELAAFVGAERAQAFRDHLRAHQPVVFVGPYEHHSNEVTWRQCLATVVEIGLAADGGVDLEQLKSRLRSPEYQGRVRIGSFSAASNVTGMRTPVHAIARLLHEHDALAFFDFAACAPYVEIDMNPPVGPEGGDPGMDAVFISPHKFLGGPGSSGLLVFNERIYNKALPPTGCGGGTVDYVSPQDQDFIADIEEREKSGTPGVLQTMKAALALQIKRAVGTERIEQRDLELTRRAFGRWNQNPNMEILGNPDPERRVAIISFNLKEPGGRYLHPKFVTALLNDLFGIQSRAGCSCAGPYGHRLLNIDIPRSEQYRALVKRGYSGIKPGWCRVGMHYVMDDTEADYVIDAIDFLATYGHLFLQLYEFDVRTGCWTQLAAVPSEERFSLQAALHASGSELTALSADDRHEIYRSYLNEAHSRAQKLDAEGVHGAQVLEGELADLQFFALRS